MMTSTFQKDHPVGARPGTLVIPKDSPPPRIRVMRIGGGEFLETEVPDVATLAEILATPGSYWIDIQGWGDEALLNEIATTVRKLIKKKILRGEQIVPFAPWRIPIAALAEDEVLQAVAATKARRPRKHADDDRNLTIPGL